MASGPVVRCLNCTKVGIVKCTITQNYEEKQKQMARLISEIRGKKKVKIKMLTQNSMKKVRIERFKLKIQIKKIIIIVKC